jgi:RND family efflux transporter MFP subunit
MVIPTGSRAAESVPAAPTYRLRRVVAVTLAILLLGALVSAALIYTAPHAIRVDEPRPPKIVRTVNVEPRTEEISIIAHGIVMPARELVVRPEVRGRVLAHHVSLVPGGRIPAGEEIVRIDRADYDLVRSEALTALAEANYELAVEQGRQVIAAREWKILEGELSEDETNRSLVLREPHLERARAVVAKAQLEIARAQIDLERTSIPAPFNSIVIDESVEVGQLVERGTAVATLVGSDEFWVKVSIPIDELRWIRLPSAAYPGARAKVILDDGTGEPVPREGTVFRLLGDLEEKGRMARILIRVRDPLEVAASNAAPPLLIGSYVRVEIEAGTIDNVIAIRREALREGHRIWVVGPNAELAIRDATILWTRTSDVLIAADAIRPGESLIVSGLRIALPGMKVAPQPIESSASEPATESER